MNKKLVEKALEKVRPMLQQDGGDIKLISVSKDGIVKVQLQGHCVGCPMSQITLKQGVEEMLKKEIPEIKEVISV